MGKRGIKICPSCKKECGARTLTCSCSYVFLHTEKKTEPIVTAPPVQEVKKVIVEKSKEDVFLYTPPKDLSPKEHAQRVLSLGKERATALLAQHNLNGKWTHVDWKIVEEELNKAK